MKAERTVLQAELEKELERLKKRLEITEGLNALASPNPSSALSGELKGRTIYIYESELEKARRTLVHEVLDLLISQIIEPYRDTTNALIKLINESAYAKKETLIERIAKAVG